MKSFVLLLKIQLLGLFGINKTLHADPAKAKRTLAIAALAVAAVVLFAGVYSSGVAQALVQIGLPEAIPLVAVLVGAVAGAVAAFLKTNGVLFGFKDYDLVMSLPVSVSSVVLSRIASLYAMSLLFGLLAMVPAFAVYAANAGVTAVGVACMALSVVLAPLLPLAAAIVLAVLIAAVSARFKHANIVVIVLTLAATLAAVFGSFALSGQADDLEAMTALGTALTTQLASAFPPAVWAAAGIVDGDLVQFLAFAAVNLVAAGVVLALIVRLFVPVNTLLMSSRPRGTFSFDGKGAVGAKASTPLRALVVKEARLLVATPIYLMNACIGYVLVFVAAVAVAVGTATGMVSLDALPPELAPLMGTVLPWGLAFFCSISSTTAASVSLEGSARWLMLTAPVPAATVLGAKAAINLIIGVPFLAVSAVLVAVSLPLDALSIAALFIVPLSACMLATFGGLALDARRPRYDWTTVYEPVKRGMPVFVVVFAGMGFFVVGMAAATLLGSAGSILLALLAGAGSLALYRATAKRGLSA
ncbi:hypothetical protein H8S61_08015 [Eggerthella sp. NSJ-70]|uniref:ABC-2 type transport system permease protein n=1 Tax=Eggerthella hominis TaxID=2763043 RepID=A0ABR7BRA8_9ACTN|nr:hypothetical protein [Eggerthella hominis]MBC5584138.1 hypothetical protein [Eggerthella hominis]